MLIGHPDAGQRSAILHSLIVSCQRHGKDPLAYPKDLHTRLPQTINRNDLHAPPDVATGYVVVPPSLVTIAIFVTIIIKTSHVGPLPALFRSGAPGTKPTSASNARRYAKNTLPDCWCDSAGS